MPVNTDILAQGLGPRVQQISAVQHIQDALTLQGLQEQQRQRQLQTQGMEQKQGQAQQLNELFGQNIQNTDAGVQLNKPQFLQQLAEVQPQAALQQQQQFAQQEQAKENQASKLANQQAQTQKFLSESSTKVLGQEEEKFKSISASYGSILKNPTVENLEFSLQTLVDRKKISPDEALRVFDHIAPNDQFDDVSIAKLQQLQQEGLSSIEQIKQAREDKKLISADKKSAREFKGKETPAQKRTADELAKQEDLRSQIPFIIRNKMIVNPKTGKVGNLNLKKIETINKATSSTASVVRQVEGLENDLKNISAFDLFTGTSSDVISFRAGLSQMMIELKGPEQFNLGVIAGPDEDLLRSSMGNIGQQTTIWKNWFEKLSDGDKNKAQPLFTKALRRLKNNTIKKYNGKLRTFEISPLTKDDILGFSGRDEVSKPQTQAFNSEAEARAAGFKNGDRVTIGGQQGVLE